MERIIIIGAGHAGVQLADSLREQQFAGAIDLIDDEGTLPYQRPPLSKDLVSCDAVLPLRAPEFYVRQAITVHSMTAVAVDTAARTVTLSNGKLLDYTKLVFATGARNRDLPCPGAELDAVYPLRTLADAKAVREKLKNAQRAVVIGAGFIGMEFAAVAAAQGIGISVLSTGPRPLNRALSSTTADWLAAEHRAHGVDVHNEEGVARIENVAGALQVHSTRGRILDADLVLYGIGVLPNTELAAGAGLRIQDGIVVDATLQTSHAGVYALGDCANYPSTTGRCRLESVQNATDQARTLARTLTDIPTEYGQVPWFWSTQNKIKVQIAGLGAPQDTQLVLGEPSTGKFSLALLREGLLVAVESVNRPADHQAARKLLASGMPITAEMLECNTLKELLTLAPAR